MGQWVNDYFPLSCLSAYFKCNVNFDRMCVKYILGKSLSQWICELLRITSFGRAILGGIYSQEVTLITYSVLDQMLNCKCYPERDNLIIGQVQYSRELEFEF